MKKDEVKADTEIVMPPLNRAKALSIARYIDNVLNPKVYCKFCGRQLKTEQSKKNGYGQGCYNRWIKSKNSKRSLI